VIRNLHPEPTFYETTYGNIPLEKFFFPELRAAQADLTSSAKQGKASQLSDKDLDAFIDDLLNSPDLEITPPDRLMSVTYQWSGHDLKEVEAMAKNLPHEVIRAKGFLKEKDRIYLFNYVMGDWSIEKSEIPEDQVQHKNLIVFIGPPESMEGIGRASKTGNWLNMGTYQPFSQTQAESTSEGIER